MALGGAGKPHSKSCKRGKARAQSHFAFSLTASQIPLRPRKKAGHYPEKYYLYIKRTKSTIKSETLSWPTRLRRTWPLLSFLNESLFPSLPIQDTAASVSSVLSLLQYLTLAVPSPWIPLSLKYLHRRLLLLSDLLTHMLPSGRAALSALVPPPQTITCFPI